MPTLSLSEFFAETGAQSSATISPDSNTTRDEQGSGQSVRASYGTRLFRGTVTLSVELPENIAPTAAKISYLEEADTLFEMTPAHLANEPSGTTTIASIPADRREFTLNAYANPAGLEPKVGGFFNVTYGGKVSLHQIVKVGGVGNQDLTFVPALPFNVNVGDTVVFGAPVFRAIIDRSTPPNYLPRAGAELSFNWVQAF